MHVRQGRRVPAIALVVRGLRDAHVRAPGFQRYLAKPVDANELRAAVVEQFRRSAPPAPRPGVQPGAEGLERGQIRVYTRSFSVTSSRRPRRSGMGVLLDHVVRPPQRRRTILVIRVTKPVSIVGTVPGIRVVTKPHVTTGRRSVDWHRRCTRSL